MTEAQVRLFEAEGRRGLEHAMKALSQLLGEPATINAGGAREVAIGALPSLLAGGSRAINLSLQLRGDAEGAILLQFDQVGTELLLRRVTGLAEPLKVELGRSTLQEIGNLLVSAFLTDLGRDRRLTLLPSVPSLLAGDAAGLTEAVLHHLGPTGERVLLLDFRFGVGPVPESADGRLLLLPTSASLLALCGPEFPACDSAQ